MKKLIAISLLSIGLLVASCQEVLEPMPNDRITNDLVLTDAGSVRTVITSLYRGLANLQAVQIIAADMTADHLTHNGTFTQYIEIGTKDISSSNGSASAMWGVVYSMLYTVNFLLEGVPNMDNLVDAQKEEFLAYARFFRGYAYFVGINSFGDMPLVLSTDITTNRNIPRSPQAELITQIESDLLFALDKIPEESFNSGDLTNGAVKAALARFYLYQENWDNAEQFATELIDGIGTADYELESNFGDVLSDFSRESILEIVYSANDNPGTSTNFGLNNLFSTRREVIPTTDIVAVFQQSGGDRDAVLTFDPNLIQGSDNGWTVSRYGPFDNVPVFRLGEMYLIRAEARAQKNNLNSARTDLNTIRQRSGLSPTETSTRNLLLLEIERERQVELGFEGHRWYDLKRTNRVNEVMRAFTPNWSETNLLWPIPLREIQNNPGLSDAQNPGY